MKLIFSNTLMNLSIRTFALVVLAGVSMVAAGCSDETTNPVDTTGDTVDTSALVKASADEIVFSEDIDELSFSIVPKVADRVTWTVRKGAPWLKLSIDRGEGEGRVVVSLIRSLMDRTRSYIDTITIDASKGSGMTNPDGKAQGISSVDGVTVGGTRIVVRVDSVPTVSGTFRALNRDLPGTFQVALEELEKYSSVLDSGITTLVTAGSGSIKGAGAMFVASGALPQNVGYVWMKGNSNFKKLPNDQWVDLVRPDTLSLKAYTDSAGSTGYIYVDTSVTSLATTLEFSANQYHRWWSDGNSVFPSLADSVQAIDKTVISAPTGGSSSADTADLTIVWSDASNDPSVRSVAIVYERSDSTFRSTGTYGSDDGSLTIAGSKMKKFSGKNVTVVLVRFRVETRKIGGVTVKFLVLNESSVDMFISRTS
jgi:hypothetical protein